jgi:hypothetical protein
MRNGETPCVFGGVHFDHGGGRAKMAQTAILLHEMTVKGKKLTTKEGYRGVWGFYIYI